MDLAKLKSFFLKVLIGCLVASGGIAVVTVLTGSFNEIFEKSLMTIFIIALHALISFGYIDLNERNKSVHDLSFFHNTTFVLIVLSFMTAIFGVWGVLPGEVILKLYGTYGVLLFAVLHGEILSKMVGNDTTTDTVVHVNYAFMIIVILLILPVIFFSDTTDFGDIYYRVLAAFGIIDAILTLTAIILHKLYLQKNPKVNPSVFGNGPVGVGAAPQPAPASSPARKGMSLIVVLLIGFLGIQIVAGLIFAIIGSRATKNARNVEHAQSQSQVTTVTPTTNPTYQTSPQSSTSYSYESSFNYNGTDYICSRTIAGTWTRKNAYSANRNDASSFSFTPAYSYDLTDYCTPR